MTSAVKFDSVSKGYPRVDTYRALRDDVAAGIGRLVGRRRPRASSVMAIEEVSFDIAEGTSTGLIGGNGAGKTTILKIISRITYPSSGVVRVRGRVGALLEVGTGMHPELTGRENVALYGRILGHSGRDIGRRFADIVEFAGVEGAIDRPVKQYSSGMQLRLGFSVAAHLEPDVLLVDEAIAVGDAGFQYRCVERMGQLVREGRTLVFVSHDMSAIETLCERAILLERGRVVHDGPSDEVVRRYLEDVQAARLEHGDQAPIDQDGPLRILGVSVRAADGEEMDELQPGQGMTVRLHYTAAEAIASPIFSIGLSDGRLGCFALASMLVDGGAPERLEGEGYVDCTFEELPLRPRTYEIWGSVRGEAGFGDLVDWQRLRFFRVMGEPASGGKSAVTHSLDDAPVAIPYRWRFGSA